MTTPDGGSAPIRALRRFARTPAAPTDVERCVRCGVALPPAHRHLLERGHGALACVCARCAPLYAGGAADATYLLVPERYLALRDFALTDDQWDDLMIPVNMAFIFLKGPTRRAVAYYPGPAGATESLLTLDHWQLLARENPILASLAPDVEALLINRLRDAGDSYLVPIDACYELVGRIRTQWRGLSGGEEVWRSVEAFFTELRARCVETTEAPATRDVRGAAHA